MAITLVLTLALGVAEQELPPTEAVAPDAEPTEEYMYLRATLVNSASPRNYSEFHKEEYIYSRATLSSISAQLF